jgi:hypothetical protein
MNLICNQMIQEWSVSSRQHVDEIIIKHQNGAFFILQIAWNKIKKDIFIL